VTELKHTNTIYSHLQPSRVDRYPQILHGDWGQCANRGGR